LDDWHAVYDVLVRYAHAVDARDYEAAGECFAEDARATYGGRELPPSRAAIVEFLRASVTSEASTHMVGGVRIEVEGDTARAEQTSFAVHLEDGRVRMRGLRYRDRLERRGGDWRIVERVHEPVWTAEAAALA
jgi:3-phenylpropionate/cinnamic acid dioxygenase small subunit